MAGDGEWEPEGDELGVDFVTDYPEDSETESDEGEYEAPENDALPNVEVEPVEGLEGFDQRGAPPSHGRRLRVKRMPRKLAARFPNAHTILITTFDGRQRLLVNTER